MQVSFFCRIIFQSESLLVHQSIYSNNIYNNIVEKPLKIDWNREGIDIHLYKNSTSLLKCL